jgi:hypothetical protein
MSAGFPVSPWLLGGMIIYIGLCAGMIAQKHGKNPILYGLLAVISPFNLILLGIWAFGPFEKEKQK